jgi:N-acetylglucosaminyldiphosphoundecaprenol N-acetyl-beta-D-mannosaminyltransferase
LFELPSVRIAMGVGGTLDFLSGRIKRAPRVLRQLGLEWLWRLGVQPWRWSRILTATVRFTWVAFWAKFRPKTSEAW